MSTRTHLGVVIGNRDRKFASFSSVSGGAFLKNANTICPPYRYFLTLHVHLHHMNSEVETYSLNINKL
jgi:hypothetical protein